MFTPVPNKSFDSLPKMQPTRTTLSPCVCMKALYCIIIIPDSRVLKMCVKVKLPICNNL